MATMALKLDRMEAATSQAITPAKHAAQACCVVAGIFSRGKSVLVARGTHAHRNVRKDNEGKGNRRIAGRRVQSEHENVSFCTPRGFVEIDAGSLERMVGTTRLELATSPRQGSAVM